MYRGVAKGRSRQLGWAVPDRRRSQTAQSPLTGRAVSVTGVPQSSGGKSIVEAHPTTEGVDVSAKRAVLMLTIMLAALVCISVLAACGSASEAAESVSTTVPISGEDAAIMAQIERILAGIKDGSVVVRGGMLQDEELPTDIDEFLDMIGYSSSDSGRAAADRLRC